MHPDTETPTHDHCTTVLDAVTPNNLFKVGQTVHVHSPAYPDLVTLGKIVKVERMESYYTDGKPFFYYHLKGEGVIFPEDTLEAVR